MAATSHRCSLNALQTAVAMVAAHQKSFSYQSVFPNKCSQGTMSKWHVKSLNALLCNNNNSCHLLTT